MSQPVCFKVPRLSKREVLAIKAVWDGTADANQQRLAIGVICNKFSRPNDLLFVPSEPDQTTFMNGRAFTGMQIYKTLNINVGQLQNDEEQDQ
ncbi:MAG: hypothetical protein QGF90_12940 [Gammaproteobacteria bacterium]|jgi:hypothetical protein|nr:hypothetical protein [Gammaproteobacteria bacterium]|tara:strand:- start:5806 stop:6084 length:279 start_codon:yes stop_codon:yes gene_type:complete